MKIVMNIQGGKALAAALRDMTKAASKEIVVDALTDAGEPMAAAMAVHMQRGPRPPHAADNVIVSPISRIRIDGITRAVMTDEYAVGVGPSRNFFYWFFQEYGTVVDPPHAAMRPGFDQSVDQSIEILVERLRASISAQMSKGGAT